MTLYLYSFNNYYNRIIKKFDTIEEYPEPLHVLTASNFNSNDGISASHVFNYYGNTPDYCIVVDSNNHIISRWYVIEAVRTAGGQYRIDLYRDVIADWYDEIIAAPTFIEKAFVSIGDTAIFNNENMGFNQIKTKETLLKDLTEIPWIVGYLASNYEGSDKAISIPTDTVVATDLTSLDQYAYHSFQKNPLFITSSVDKQTLRFNFYNTGIAGNRYVVGSNLEGDNVQPELGISKTGLTSGKYWLRSDGVQAGYPVPYNVFLSGEYVMSKAADQLTDVLKDVKWTNYAAIGTYFPNTIYRDITEETIAAENGKILKVGNQYYKVSVRKGDYTYVKEDVPVSSALGVQMANTVAKCDRVDMSSSKDPVFEYEIGGTPYYFDISDYFVDAYELTIPTSSNRLHLTDAPYDMFAIPLGEIYLGEYIYERLTSAELGFKLATAIQKALGGGETSPLYDIQLLPYSPLPDKYFTKSSAGVVALQQNKLPENAITYAQKASNKGQKNTGMVWITESSFTKYLNYTIPVSASPLDFKVENECDMYRLASPNYNTGFEFSATKNSGVSGFRVDCKYAPVSPYIRVAPLFNGLYGTIADDARGLICGGDFSLSQISDAWLSYQRQNKNFQDIFDRQIENIEFNNNIARIQEKVGMATGVLSAGITGGMAGSMMKGGVGAAVGTIGGVAASAAGGIADIRLNESLRNEALDYTRDNFGYQLGNIKALPLGLTKVSAFNPNNKVFPVLEYYTCTDIEKQALRNKITYNGMTVMRIGKIEQFQQSTPTYIKGQLIRLENLGDDYHVSSAIASEIYKGVYI